MQRYRINYHWLIGVFASAFVLAVAAFFVWRWQVERNASTFLTQAEEAVAAGNSVDAFDFYGKYVKLRPKEDDARIKMATAALDMIKDPDVSFENRSLALGTVDQTVRTTDDNVLRRELAELMMLLGRPQDSLSHIQGLLVENPQDPELNAMQIRALFLTKDNRVKQMALDLIGYNKNTEEFEADQALLKNEPDVYSLLAEKLQKEDEDVELARRVIDRMVEINPESAQANLQKSVFLTGLGEREAKDYLDKAYQLDPKDAAIISRMGMRGLRGFLYADSKYKYFDAVTDYELAVAEVADKESDDVLTESYSKAKEEFEAAVTGLERIMPSYEEAKAKFFEAKASFEQALGELAAEEPAAADDADCQDALERFGQAKTEFAASLPDYEEAKKYFAAGMEEHPDNVLFYRLISEVENRLGNKAAAMKILDKGIRELDRSRSIDLVIFKIDLLINDKDYDAVDDELKRMTLLNRPDLQPLIDFEKARVLFNQKEWVDAARELRRVRPLLYNRRNFQVLAGTMLGVCYESSGSTDQAKQAYTVVLNDFPNHEPAQRGLERVQQRIDPTRRGDGVELDQVVNATLELPKAEQDWDKIDKLVEQVIKDRGIGEARAYLMKAKVLIKREKYQESKDLIRQAYRASPDDIDVNFAAVLLVLSNPTEGPEAALKTLDRLEKKWGVSLRSLAQRAEIIMRLNPEDVTEQLHGLETQAAEFPDADKLRLQHVLGLKFEQLGKNDEARDYYQRAAQQDPTNLPVRMRLFELALRQKDDAAMRKAQEAILEIVKSKDNSNYLLTEAKRLLLNYGMQRIGRDELAKVRDLLDKALIERSEWHELHITYGQLHLLLDGDVDGALEHFDKALESGPARSNAVSIQVKLLYERGLFKRARERMDLLGKELRPKLLGRLEAEIFFKTGDKERAFQAAEKLAESRPNDASTQVWFSKLAQDAGKLDVAATVLRGAQRLNPGDPDSWLRLIGLYTEQRKFDDVRTINREAHLASDAEFL
ncbi:MAG: tetratricopeptide repeat protein, partial [Bythopirellula sp.]